jgi:hypothetical protein
MIALSFELSPLFACQSFSAGGSFQPFNDFLKM